MKLPLLLLGTLLLSQPSPSPPPLCRVQAEATPSLLPGIYTVIIQVRSDTPCPPDGRAFVRLESGRVYPWREVSFNEPAVYFGVPWYWVASWQSRSGKTFRVPIIGMRRPWTISEVNEWKNTASWLTPTGRPSGTPWPWPPL